MKYTAIRSEGGLLPYDLLDEILAETAPGQKAADFGLPKGRRVSDEIQRVWLDAQELWSRFKAGRERLTEKDPHGTTLTRDRWIGPLLTDPVRFSYDLHYQPSAVVLEGLTFAISHRAGEPADSPPVHIEGCAIELDKRPPKYRTSPQAMVQEFLNRSEPHLWGVATNGLRFRLLRDSVRTARPTYLEFDLETILEGVHYNEFVLFYRLCHRTRLPQAGHHPEDCWLEKYYQQSIEKGGRVRDKLRDGVEEALKILGTGFLRHPANTTLLEKIDSGKLDPDQYHRQLLLLVYRLLFLTVAEDRQLVISIGENAERNQSVYLENYSIGKLRERAEGMLDDSGFNDLWVGLAQTFKLFADSNDTNALGIPPLNGDLFSHTTIPDLESAQLSNFDLLRAVRWLMFYREGNIQQRVNYAALNVEEFGSVYESLLDFRALISKDQDGRKFELGVGSERKTTGSYYTRPELVRELIQSALVPVLEDRLSEAEKRAKGQSSEAIRNAKIEALLLTSVCDPACGSGHFLLESARRLGKELARIRVGEDEPTPEQFHIAVRDVITHCIHGVDVNPLAVDLCKLALWLEGHWAGKPLSFLDHRIRCGNSLIGVLDPAVMGHGIPDDAFNPVTGDDKKVAAAYKKRNKAEKVGQKRLDFEQEPAEHTAEYAQLFGVRLDFPEDKPSDVKRKAELFEKARGGADWWHDWTASNLWTASYFVPLTKPEDPLIPTHEPFNNYFLHHKDRPQMTGFANSLAGELRYFHWCLEFPDVFEKGGFDVVLGNPPWERPEFHEDLFWASEPYISSARTDEERQERVKEYRASSDPEKKAKIQNFDLALHALGSTSKFWKESSRFPLTAAGKFNIFALFSELAVSLLVSTGRVGIIVPSGILTDDVCKTFFADITSKRMVVSDLNIENRSGWFPDIDSRIQFCLLTLSKKGSKDATSFFYLNSPAEANDERRKLRLTSADYALLNPNTLTSPLCRTEKDLRLTEKLYTRNAVLLDETKSQNQYDIKIRRILNMGSGPVKTKARNAAKLLANNFALRPDKSFDNGTEVYLPILESKLFHQYHSRFATYDALDNDRRREAKARDSRDDELIDPFFNIQPRNWFSKSDIDEIYRGNWDRPWILAFRDIARSTDERSMISAILPYSATDLTVRVIVSTRPTAELMLLHANLNSLPLDYILRQFLPSTHVSDYVSEQLAIVELKKFLAQDRSWIIERVLKLSYACHSLKALACELGHEAAPFPWNPVQRHCLRTELDAYFAHLYGLTRDELIFILDPTEIFGKDFPSETFRVLKEKDEREFKEFRTRSLVLSVFDLLSQSERFKGEKRDCTISGKTWSVGD